MSSRLRDRTDDTDVVDDEQWHERHACELGPGLALAFGFGDPGDPVGRFRELNWPSLSRDFRRPVFLTTLTPNQQDLRANLFLALLS
jgi:hypothetical protein